MQRSFPRRKREGCDARWLHLAVKRLVIRPERLVVRSVARLRRRQHDDHRAGDRSTTHTTRRLDVFRGRFRLTVDEHEAEPGYVDADPKHAGSYEHGDLV